MGRHHARVYAQADNVELVGVVDSNPQTRQDVVDEWGGRAFETVDDLIGANVDAVSIATPTVNHRAAAEQLLQEQVACLIEKPLAPDVQEARAIAETADRTGTVLQVGHIVRYDPLMKAITDIDGLRPKFLEVDRISPMTFRSIDVGVVLDMMIHDLDVLLMLVGAEPEEIHANAVSVLGDVEDVCNARLIFPPDETGERCVANVTASRLALKTERKLRVICEGCYVSADFVKRSGTVVRKHANEQQLEEVRRLIREGEDLSDIDYLELVEVEDLMIDEGEPLKLQIGDFLASVRNGKRPEVDARAGFSAVRTAERIVEAARQAGARRV
jgi:predicted dehydrogenase